MKNKITTKLPIHSSGANKGKVDWDKTIGMKINVVYNGKNYNGINILKIKKQKMTVEYNQIISTISKGNFSMGSFGNILNLKTNRYHYNVGDIVENKGNSIEVLKQIKILRKNGVEEKGYLIKCLKCQNKDGESYTFELRESDLKKGIGCPCCGRNKIVYGINDIYTKYPGYLIYFENEEDAKYVGKGSVAKVKVRCPLCGNVKMIAPNTLTRRGIGCICGDGRSYNEKFIYSLLKQLNLSFETERSFKWSKNIKCENIELSGDKRYDFYLASNYKTIVETNGKQHYEKGFERIISNKKVRTFTEEQENDKLKERLAKDNGIEHYIVLDCRKSELDWVKNSILNSELAGLFDLDKIDWLECDMFAQNSNLKKEVCDFRKLNPQVTTNQIGQVFGINENTVSRYLKFGNIHGWCEYDSKNEQKRLVSKKIACIELNTNFESIQDCCNQMTNILGIKFLHQQITKVLNGKNENYKGYTFKLI